MLLLKKPTYRDPALFGNKKATNVQNASISPFSKEIRMDDTQLTQKIEQLVQEAQTLVPKYLADKKDWCISEGNVSLCIIDARGRVFGEMWGENKLRMRNTFGTAWQKASQVWITGYPTCKYEELIYTNKLDWGKFGIIKPDFVGWEGGYPVTLKGDIKLAVAFSGMRGESDSAVVKKIVAAVGGKISKK
jgi:uncharacterized protein GlcG (DUF336 family)